MAHFQYFAPRDISDSDGNPLVITWYRIPKENP
jgi:hypothetical protein